MSVIFSRHLSGLALAHSSRTASEKIEAKPVRRVTHSAGIAPFCIRSLSRISTDALSAPEVAAILSGGIHFIPPDREAF